MGLYRKLEDDMKAALKNKDATKLSVLRMLVSAVKMAEIQKNVKELPETETLQILQRQIKQHKESIEQFEKGNRADLAEKEKSELKILEAYMPEQLDEKELVRIIDESISECGASVKSDTGKVMKLVMDKVKGKADGKLVNQLVMKKLK